jgi:hypothetical protein
MEEHIKKIMASKKLTPTNSVENIELIVENEKQQDIVKGATNKTNTKKAEAVKKIEEEEEEEAAKKIEDEAEATKKIEDEAEATKKIEEEAEAAKKIEEEATKKVEEEAEATKKIEEEAEATKKVEEAEATKKVEEEAEATKKIEEEAEATKKVEEEAEAIKKVEEEAEAAKKVEEEAEAAKKIEEEAEAAKKIEEEAEKAKSKIPKMVFVVPYRDRQKHKEFFHNHMKSKILHDVPENEYKIHYIHQKDARDFNRGAMKNIGFLYVKESYPDDYKNITLVFNDVDTIPFDKKTVDYNTIEGTVKHFYGYKFALGGIVSIKAGDFEKSGGFPNFWSWGYEDNMLKNRISNAGLKINQDQFYPIMDENILQMKDGLERVVNRKEFDRFVADTSEGFGDIKNLKYDIDNDFVNVSNFDTLTIPSPQHNATHNLSSGNPPFKKTIRRRAKMGMVL